MGQGGVGQGGAGQGGVGSWVRGQGPVPVLAGTGRGTCSPATVYEKMLAWVVSMAGSGRLRRLRRISIVPAARSVAQPG